MEYQYEKEPRSFEDLASGRVLWNARGTTAFPVRLASEIYLRGRHYLQRKSADPDRKYTLYDPCCGGAYLLTTLGLLHGGDFRRILGSDVDPDVLELARRNLSLINEDGLRKRMDELGRMHREYGKESHRGALDSAARLQALAAQRGSVVETVCFQADATRRREDEAGRGEVDIVVTDIPYGDLAQWATDSDRPVERLLDNLLHWVTPRSVVAVVADKRQTIDHPGYARLERMKIGKRQAVLLEPRG